MRRGAVLLAIFLAGAGLAVVAGASHHATCTATQKSQRLAALAAYRKKMPAERAAYFARHKSAKKRAAFLKRQQTALKALRAAAACTIPPPPTTTGLPTLPIPTDEPGFSWSIPKPEFADNRSGPDSPPVGEWGPKSDPYWLPSTGTLHGLIVVVEYPGATAAPVSYWHDYLVPTAEHYYQENSYGRLTLDLNVFPRVVQMSKPAGTYGLTDPGQAGPRAFMSDVTALIDPLVDFRAVDVVFVVAPGYTAPIVLYRTWPGEGIVRDGHELRWGVIGHGGLDTGGPTTHLLAHHLITHELGHLLGLPDLYDNAHPDQGAAQYAWAGRWDIMSDDRASSHMFAWHKWLLGWLDPRQVRGLTAPGSTEATITPLEIRGGLKAVFVPVSPTVLYVVEDRQQIGEDEELCDHGVLVWIVDGSRSNVDHNAVVQGPGRSYNGDCGAIYDAGLDPGATFEDSQVKVEVLEAVAGGSYRVRVTRK